MLRLALAAAGFTRLGELASAAGICLGTIDAIRCGARRLTRNVRGRIATALKIAPEMVDEILLARSP
jgi:hypothetical protein